MVVYGNNKIRMTRGDSETLTVSCEQRPFVDGDAITFSMCKSKDYPAKLLEKRVTTFVDGKAIIEFKPEDTSKLDFREYVYDIQLTQADGTVTTIVKPAAFKIEFEVT